MKDRRQRRAGVLDVHVDVAGEERAIADQRAAEIQPALHRQPGLALDGLRDDLAEDQLLGEVLRADDDRAGARAASSALPARTTSANDRGDDDGRSPRSARGGAPTSRRSSHSRLPSTISASSAAGIAPARMTVESTIDRPR